MTVDKDPSEDWYEREYNLSLVLPQMPAITGTWSSRATAFRELYPSLEIAYGDHPRERMDLFRAENARGTLVFIHGGYWRARSKEESSWIAESLLKAGYSVALFNYPLCPESSFERIVESVRTAFATLYLDVLSEDEKQRIVVSGTSAGGYLAALLVATDWAARGLPTSPFQGAMPISGIFELEPLTHTSINDALRFSVDEARHFSLHHAEWQVPAALTFVVGGDETSEFHRQSAVMVEQWADLHPRLVAIPGTNHFDVLDGLATDGSLLHRTLMALFQG